MPIPLLRLLRLRRGTPRPEPPRPPRHRARRRRPRPRPRPDALGPAGVRRHRPHREPAVLPAGLGPGAAVAARRGRRALARRAPRRPGLLRRAPGHRRPARLAAGPGRDVRPAPGARAAAADVERRDAGRRARHRDAHPQPLALRGDGGHRGRGPRLHRAQRLAQPPARRPARHLAAAGHRDGQPGADLALRRSTRPSSWTTWTGPRSPARTTTAGGCSRSSTRGRAAAG